MKKLLLVTVLVALLALGAQSFRTPRQVEEEEKGTFTEITDSIKSYYGQTVDTLSGYMEDLRGMKLEEKIKNFYADTTNILSTYFKIGGDQLYHSVYSRQ